MATFPTVFSTPYYLAVATSEYQGITAMTTGVLTLGSTTLVVADSAGVVVGALVIGIGIPQAAVVAVVTGNTITLSKAVTDGYKPPTFVFDSSSAGFDKGYWTSYSGSTDLSFFSGPSPRMQAWLNYNLQLSRNVGLCLQNFAPAFSLDNAVGTQLDTLGVILGQSRYVPVLIGNLVYGGSGYAAGNVVTAVQGSNSIGMTFNVGSVTSGKVTAISMLTVGSDYNVGEATVVGGAGTGLVIDLTLLQLNDDDYRTFLKCTVLRNHWNGQVSGVGPATNAPGSITQMWRTMFGTQSFIQVADGGATSSYNASTVMTANITVSFGPYISPAITVLTINGYLVPRPQGVNYTFTAVYNGPYFGFDEYSIQYYAPISGFDSGKWSN